MKKNLLTKAFAAFVAFALIISPVAHVGIAYAEAPSETPSTDTPSTDGASDDQGQGDDKKEKKDKPETPADPGTPADPETPSDEPPADETPSDETPSDLPPVEEDAPEGDEESFSSQALFFPSLIDLDLDLQCSDEGDEVTTWIVTNNHDEDVEYTYAYKQNIFDFEVWSDTVPANGTDTFTTPLDENKVWMYWFNGIFGHSFEKGMLNDDCVPAPEVEEPTDETAPVVSVGNGNGNSPANVGPAHETTVQGDVAIYATIEDENLSSYHLRIVPEGGPYGHSCGDALGAPENQGFGGCDYAFNQAVVTSTNVSDEVIVTVDTTELADGRYEVILGAIDEAGNRTDADYLQDPSVVIIVNNPPKVSVGSGNGNDPENTGPVHESVVSEILSVFATVQDGDLAGYHLRIVPEGGPYGHSCGDALGAPENQGLGGCGYVYNQVTLTSTNVLNEQIATIDTALIPNGTYELILGAADSLGQRTAADHMNDPRVIFDIFNDEEEIDYPYGIIVAPVASSTHATSTLLTLDADYFDGDELNDDNVQWAVRYGSCSGAANTRYGNVDGKNTPFTWDGTSFTASVDISSAATGTYCFVFNPTDDAGETDVRETRMFDIVAAPTVDPEPEPTDTTVVVRPSAMNGWIGYVETATATGAFVDGPAPAPLGVGSAQLTVQDANGRYELALFEQYTGTRLDEINELSYSTYRTAGGDALALALQFEIDTDITDENTAWNGRLVYEPYYTHTVNTGEWQTWDTQDDSANGNWWFSKAPGNTMCSMGNPCTWSEVLAAFPDAGVRDAGALSGGVFFKAGGGWSTGFDGNVDEFVIRVNSDRVTYDFEPNLPVDEEEENEEVPPVEEEEDSNGNDSSRRSGRRSGNSSGGQVLGASVCSPYLTSYLMTRDTTHPDDQVILLQEFLNAKADAGLEVNGIYDAATVAAVMKFQLDHANKILDPWVALGYLDNGKATGNVYKLTQWWINTMECGNEDTAVMPLLP